MDDCSLETLARAAGIGVQWTDAFGQARVLSEPTLHSLLGALQLPSQDAASRVASLRLIEERAHALPVLITADAGGSFELPHAARGVSGVTACDEQGQEQKLPLTAAGRCRAPAQYGYYQLGIGGQTLTLAVAPPRCYSVGDSLGTQQRRAWGLAAQVYSLRRHNDGGVGDSHAVAELAQVIGRAGGDALALSPLHAMSPILAQCSPYSPSHRGLLNWLHADAAQVLGATALQDAIDGSGLASRWQQAQQGALVDWPVVYALRRQVFGQLYEHFEHASLSLREDLQRFEAQGGDSLRKHAWHAARQTQAAARGESTAWRQWPEDWREEAAASRFAQTQPRAVKLEIFLQWLAARSWDQTARLAQAAGLGLGLIWDLAVGFEAGGSEAWTWREQVLEGFELGAPPDAFNPGGQSWGIATYSPWGLQASGFKPFIELLRANMRRGGGIRIDHIIGLQHLWVLPCGRPSAEGGYIRQPLEDLLRLTALESWRHRAIVIGEDLGTVPQGLREQLAARGVLGLDVLLFTRDERGAFLPPERWRQQAVAMTTTHDLPPLAGWREGTDLENLARVQGWNQPHLQQCKQAREQDVLRLDQALASAVGRQPAKTSAADMGAYFGYLGRTPSPLVLIPLEDALASRQQPNLPGTVDTHPNWRQRLPDNTLARLPSILPSIAAGMQGSLPA